MTPSCVPKQRMHHQQTFIFHQDTSFGSSSRKRDLDLCCGQRLLRLTLSILLHRALSVNNEFFFFKVNSSVSIIIFGHFFGWNNAWKKHLLTHRFFFLRVLSAYISNILKHITGTQTKTRSVTKLTRLKKQKE